MNFYFENKYCDEIIIKNNKKYLSSKIIFNYLGYKNIVLDFF